MISYEVFNTALKNVGRPPNPKQQEAVEASKDEPLFVVAGPGTGKTATLTMRILKLVFVDQVEPRGILATTFTRKAAAELRSRILTWGYGLQEYLKTHGSLSRLDLMWVERVDVNQIRTGTIDSICEELLQDHRVPGTDPPILADDFVARTLLLNKGMFGDSNGQRRDQDINLSTLLARQCGKLRKKDGQPYDSFHVGEKTDLLQTMWDRRHHDQLDWAAFWTSGTTPEDQAALQLLDAAMNDYRQELQDRMMVDFAQLEQSVLDRLRLGGFQEFTAELEAVLVDEYQDTNLLQENLYFELAKRCNGALTVVGDDDQSLYRFRGATVDLFRDFQARYATEGGFGRTPRKIFLNINYRSTRNIIEFVNRYAALDQGYQSVRVTGKPPLVNPTPRDDEPVVLGMFRKDQDQLAADLADFIYQVTRGSGYQLPNGQIIQVDRDNGGDVGDCALLCSSPQEVSSFDSKPRLPAVLKERLKAQHQPMDTFNPRGQDFASLPIVQRLGGLLVICLDPHGQARMAAAKALGQKTAQTLDYWTNEANRWLLTGGADPELIRYVEAWKQRKPDRAGHSWPQNVPCLRLLYDLSHWLPDLHDDPEGQVYREVFTRQLGAAEQISPFRTEVITDPDNPDLSITSVRHLLNYFLGPIVSGTAKVDEDLLEAFPRDRLSILSIHQSKGLEFPLVIVDVGSDFRTNSWMHAFKRFPRDANTPHNLEDLMRPTSPLGALSSARPAKDRAFDDLYRQYFVAFSRPEEVLLLIGLTGTHPITGSIPNVATGWDRNGTNQWATRLPFMDI